MVAFPIAKLAYLAIKQVSKPIAALIKRRAKSHPFFRNYICMPPAQFYHWTEVNVRMRILGLGKAENVAPLKEEMAIDLGADMLGEFVIFSIAALTLFLEYRRSSAKEELKEEQRKQQIMGLEKRVEDLGLITEAQEMQIRNMQRILGDLDSRNKSLVSKIFGPRQPVLEEPKPDKER